METWLGNQFPLELRRRCSVAGFHVSVLKAGTTASPSFKHVHCCTTIKIQTWSVTMKISLLLPFKAKPIQPLSPWIYSYLTHQVTQFSVQKKRSYHAHIPGNADHKVPRQCSLTTRISGSRLSVSSHSRQTRKRKKEKAAIFRRPFALLVDLVCLDFTLSVEDRAF